MLQVFWNSTSRNGDHLPLIAWGSICKTIASGGLGIKLGAAVNKPLLLS